MIDTHCHLLPSVDDGPKSDTESVRLARRLRDDGVTTVVCTPHFSDRWPTPTLVARTRHKELRRALEAVEIDLETTVAAEVSVTRALETPLARLRVRAIARRFLVVELVKNTIPAAPGLVFERLTTAGLLPVFAHPERCSAVRRNPALLDDLRGAGALVQVVSPSLAGAWGDDVWAAGWDLVESGRADLLASDAHHASASSPGLAAVADLVEVRYGAEARRELTELAPARLFEVAATEAQ